MKEKKSKPTPATALTLAECKRRGWPAQVVEQTIRIPGGRTFKRDLFNVLDVVAIIPGVGILGIQCTSGTHHADRSDKVLDEPRAHAWIKAGGLIQVWSWSKKREPGKKRERWELRADELVVKARTT